MRPQTLIPNLIALAMLICTLSSCQSPPGEQKSYPAMAGDGGATNMNDKPFVVVLGIAQDAGYPQAGCNRDCCRQMAQRPDLARSVACLAIVDPVSHQRWMIDATPDFRKQSRKLDETAPPRSSPPDLHGIFLTHAHIGHYTGLMFLGHESMGASNVPVYAMPRMIEFLSTNGPWDQLVNMHNIALKPLRADETVRLNERLSITPFRVPHREEYSEVVGFRIDGPSRSVLYIPDIDKWERWDRSIETNIRSVDRAYLDGTFFDDSELPGRDMSQIPHPLISESIRRFDESLDDLNRAKVRFIHLNHTNPAIHPESPAREHMHGTRIAEELERFEL